MERMRITCRSRAHAMPQHPHGDFLESESGEMERRLIRRQQRVVMHFGLIAQAEDSNG